MGTLLGLSAGFAPGPLLLVALSETVRGRLKNGLLVSVSPLITDLPIVLIALWLISRIPGNSHIFGGLQILGGLFLVYLALGDLLRSRVPKPRDVKPTGSLKKGVVANFLNPSPYLWWATIGAPTVLTAWNTQKSYAVVFVVSFYAMLIGSKIGIVVVTDGFRDFLASHWYRRILRSLGILLGAFGLYLVSKGVLTLT